MNPFGLSASELLIWGLVLHLIADWPLQNDWMATKKALRRLRHNPTTMTGELGTPYNVWWDRHPAAYVHAGIHGLMLAIVFGWVAVPLAVTHLVIDCRWLVAKLSQLIAQTQPGKAYLNLPVYDNDGNQTRHVRATPLYDVGTEVRFWTDQVWHIACIALAAVLVTL